MQTHNEKWNSAFLSFAISSPINGMNLFISITSQVKIYDFSLISEHCGEPFHQIPCRHRVQRKITRSRAALVLPIPWQMSWAGWLPSANLLHLAFSNECLIRMIHSLYYLLEGRDLIELDNTRDNLLSLDFSSHAEQQDNERQTTLSWYQVLLIFIKEYTF